MIDFLLGVPGKLKTISDYLTTYWTITRAAKVDNLDTTITSRAPASTALSNVTWTNAVATAAGGAVQTSDPMLAPPIAANFGKTIANTISTTYVTALSITGKGVLKGITQYNGVDGSLGYVIVTIDGVLLPEMYSSTWANQTGIIIGTGYTTLSGLSGYDFLPFRSSLLIEHKKSGSGTLYTEITLHRTT